MTKRLRIWFVLATAVGCAAFATPSVAGASVWGPPGGTHTLDALSFSFAVTTVGGGWTCATSLGIHVRNLPDSWADITNVSFTNCSGTGAFGTCAVTMAYTGVPGALDGFSPSIINFRVHADVGFSGTTCVVAGTNVTVGGKLTDGAWSAFTHSVAFAGAPGLTASTSGVSLGPVPVTGLLVDTANTLTLS